MDQSVYDFIVTGAGSAGCAVAGRLAESGQFRVLLLEAGGTGHNPWIHIPIGYTKTYTDPRFNWMFESEPENELNGRTMYQPWGKVLGGTSAINGMVYMRGNAADYDEWSQRGCQGWDYESVLPYFRKAEDQERGADRYHGVGGPLHVSDQPQRGALGDALLEASVQAGIAPTRDFNGSQQEGCGFYQTTTKNGRRWSSASAYLRPRRQNLIIQTRAHATRVLIENNRAIGVEYRSAHGITVARARREVVVSSGAYGSPHLLQLSGLGPAELLQSHGIQVIRNMPGIGDGLQDHCNIYVAFRCAKPVTMNELANGLSRRLLAAARYALFRSGPMSSNGLLVGAFVRSDQRLERPDLQISMFAWSTLQRTRSGIKPHPFPGFTLSAAHLRPDSRGSVRIKSADPFTQPEIRLNFLRSENDTRTLIVGVRTVRKIAAQPALAPFVVHELQPGPSVQTEDELIADIRARSMSCLHPAGTCRMGTDDEAIVDPQLRVIGIEHLRVADASIMPTIIAGNTNAPAIMIGEKCAAMILDAAQTA